jgi:hypothetical protein
MIVDKGDDFPPRFTAALENLGKETMYFRPRHGNTTRALNIYSGSKIGLAELAHS